MHRLALALLLAICGVADAQFSAITVFGDSLSDVGNLNSSTLGIQPGRDYFEGRFSNGPVYSERLADKLGLGPLRATTDDGTNYAYGGARTSGTTFFEGGLLINDLDEQIEDFRSDRQLTGMNKLSPDELVVVFIGSNDFILGNATNAAGRANRVLDQIDNLIDVGAKNLLSINLPLLGETPAGGSNRESLNQRAIQFNETLAARLDTIDAPDVQLFRFNMAEMFSVLLEEPNAFGFTNTTDQGLSATNAEGYLFWDGNHPTTRAHELIAEATFRQLQSIPAYGGDFDFDSELSAVDVDLLSRQVSNQTNRLSFDLDQNGELNQADVDELLQSAMRLNGDTDFDGMVGFPDFLILAANFGRTDDDLRWSSGDFDSSGEVAFLDFLILSRNFGEAFGSAVTIPEPTTQLQTLLALIAVFTLRNRRPSR